jgi:hypothetical protein
LLALAYNVLRPECKRTYLVQKAQIIGTCLLNANMVPSLDEAERAVRDIFAAEYPKSRYSDWNTELDDRIAFDIVTTVGRASRINVVRFIEQLWWRSNSAKFRRDIEANYGAALWQADAPSRRQVAPLR